MFIRLDRILATALTALTALTVAPAASLGATDTVALRFAWPVGLQGRVSFESQTTRSTDGQSEKISLTGRYAFATSRAGKDLLVSFEDIRTKVDDPGSGSDIQAMVKKYLARVTSVPPSYIIAADGKFRRLEGMERFRRNLLDGLDDAFARYPQETRSQVAQVVERVLTRKQLQAGIAAEWNMAVGTWLGARMDRGDVYELTHEQAVPALNDMAIPMRSRFRFAGRVPCNGAGGAERCVELEMRTSVDPDGLAAAVKAFMAKLPAGQAVPRIDAVRQETVVRLITEPDTLIPHLLESSRRTETTVSVNGRSRSSARVRQTRYVYSY